MRQLPVVVRVGLLIIIVSLSNSLAQDSPTPPDLRLPAGLASPVRYRLDLTVVPDGDVFTGTVEIDLQVAKSTSLLWLNADKLTVKEAALTAGGEKLAAKVITVPKDFVGFTFEHPIGPGEATLRVSYEAEISRKEAFGIFQKKDGDRWYVYSQFEWSFARRAFPCFDEPNYKVPWQMTLNVKNDSVALSNTPIVGEMDAGEGMKSVRFAQTKPLPSYLVALAVGDFDLVDVGTVGQKNTPIRIAVPRGRASEAEYSAQTTPAILNLLEEYFGIPYPYEKLDEVAVPDVGFAMENAGLITYGAALLLAKHEDDTAGRQRLCALVTAHEIAHQWFGDLVTTAWWDDIWLNEGFASWMTNKILARFKPEWRTSIDGVNDTQYAMTNDGLVSARRVRQPIVSSDDIANAFDGITYSKGAALLNMFESHIGEERFRAGVRRYLERHAWKNATSGDFLDALAGENEAVGSAFAGFLDRPGVPLVTATLNCDAERPVLELAQRRFLPLGSVGNADQIWKIPVCVRYATASGEQRQCILLDRPSTRMELANADGCPTWVEANAGADGYYRVLYQGDLLDRLLRDGARPLALPERVALIGDIAALTGNGEIPLGKALALVPTLAQDSERQVVQKTMEITTRLEDRVVSSDLLPVYRRYLADLYGPRARQLGWKATPGDSDDDRLLRPSVLRVVANEAEDAELVAQAKTLAIAWMSDRKAVDPEMIGTAVSTAARHGDRKLFDRLREAARQEKGEVILRNLLGALGSFPDPGIESVAFSSVLTDEFTNEQSLSILYGATRFPDSRRRAYEFVKKNWQTLSAKLPDDRLATMPYLASGFCDEANRQDVEKFFTGRSTKHTGGPRVLAQVLEGIDLCIAYKKQQQPSVTEFLRKYENAP